VKDIASASILATAGGKTGIFNIGTGKGTRTMELYRLILETLRKKGIEIPDRFVSPNRGEARDGDIRVSTLNAGKAKEELGFQPKFDLAAGLSETIDWYLESTK
jgi:nucleoside-diphosphate-sugar epimerase